MKVFLSSTHEDLKGSRKKARNALERLGLQVIGMEDWGAQPYPPIAYIREQIEKCDLFVGIYAYRYGEIPPKETCSYIELEFDHATKVGLKRFCFCVDKDKTPNWPPEYIEGEPGQSKLEAFKDKIKELLVDWFTTPLDLGMKVAGSLGRHLWETKGSAIYSMVWKTSTLVSPVELMKPGRGHPKAGFHPYYFTDREEEQIFQRVLAAHKNHILLVGRPLTGKTRMVYEGIKRFKEPLHILIPHYKDLDIQLFHIPPHFYLQHRKILFLDDLHRYVDLLHFSYFLNQFLTQTDIIIIATCQSGQGYEKVNKNLLKEKLNLEDFFTIIKINPIIEEKAQKIAKTIGKQWSDVNFDGTIGSVLLPLKEMEQRYKNCSIEEKTVLRALKTANKIGFFLERSQYPLVWIKAIVREKYSLSIQEYQWLSLIENLELNDFVKFQNENLIIEEIYLEKIIDPDCEISLLSEFASLQPVFEEDPKAMVRFGYQLMLIPKFSHLKKAINAFETVLKVWEKNSSPQNYALVQGYIGYCYEQLADIKKEAEYSHKGISAYENALRIYVREISLEKYAQIKRSVGSVYKKLARIEQNSEYYFYAIEAFERALAIYNKETNPFEHIVIQISLASIFIPLAEIEHKTENMKKAIYALEEALRIKNLEKSKELYFEILSLLGSIYRSLIEIEEKKENCLKAIHTFEKALTVFTATITPLEYAEIQTNLGTFYGGLVESEDRVENCQKAINAFEEAIKIYNLEENVEKYSEILYVLGNNYMILAEVINTIENCQKAINAFEKVLKIKTFREFPLDYAQTQGSLGFTYGLLAEKKDKRDNCEKAIYSFKEALKIYTLEHHSIDYALIHQGLGNVYGTLAKEEDKVKNCRKAIHAFQEALTVFKLEEFPMDHVRVQVDLEKIRNFCD